MTRINIIGGTGYAGSNLVKEAAERGHEVVSFSRNLPEVQTPEVKYVRGTVLDSGLLELAIQDADVVLVAISPRGELAGKTRGVIADVANSLTGTSTRLGVVGGAGSLLTAPSGPKVAESEGFPDEFKAEAAEMEAVLEDLRAAPADLDWFYVSPAGGFGAWAPGVATGKYRVGGDVLLVSDDGSSSISGADFAAAVISEVEVPAHKRARFTVAY